VEFTTPDAVTGAGDRSGSPNSDRNSSISERHGADRELVLDEGRRRNATSRAEMAPTKPPDAGAGSGADISSESCADPAGILVPIRGNNPTPVGVIAARWPRPACATAGCADIATATPNASAKAPARSMYRAAPNAVISCQFRKFTDFAPPSQGKEERRRKTRVVRYLFSGSAGQPGRATSTTVLSYARRKPVGRLKIREWPLNGAQSRAGSRWAFWSRRLRARTDWAQCLPVRLESAKQCSLAMLSTGLLNDTAACPCNGWPAPHRRARSRSARSATWSTSPGLATPRRCCVRPAPRC